MKLHNIIITTAVARPGMEVADLFRECVAKSVPALPFCADGNKVADKVSMKNVMRLSCLPEYVVELADVLGNHMSCVDDAEGTAARMVTHLVDHFVSPIETSVGPGASLITAIAKMEKHATSYLFVLEDGEYRGVVTRQGIAARILEVTGRAA